MRGLAFLWGGGGLSEQAPRARANSRSRVRLVCLQYCVHFDGLLGSVSFRLPGGGRGLSEPCTRTARELVHTHTRARLIASRFYAPSFYPPAFIPSLLLPSL